MERGVGIDDTISFKLFTVGLEFKRLNSEEKGVKIHRERLNQFQCRI